MCTAEVISISNHDTEGLLYPASHYDDMGQSIDTESFVQLELNGDTVDLMLPQLLIPNSRYDVVLEATNVAGLEVSQVTISK